jgi:hypothetical protein
MPSRIKLRSMASDSEAGPMVATILVRRTTISEPP